MFGYLEKNLTMLETSFYFSILQLWIVFVLRISAAKGEKKFILLAFVFNISQLKIFRGYIRGNLIATNDLTLPI